MDMQDIDSIKWILEDLALSEPENIDSNEYEIIGKDENGLSGIYTIKITDIANKALEQIIVLQSLSVPRQEHLEAVERYNDAMDKYKDALCSMEEKHQETLAELEKRLIDKVCGYLEGCDATVEDVEKLIKSTIKDIRGES